MRLHGCLLICLFLLSACNSGTEPEPVFNQITGVEISDSPVMSRFVSVFSVSAEDTLIDGTQLLWKLKSANGDTKDTLTTRTSFFWEAPEVTGQYTHSVQLLDENEAPISDEFEFSLEVVPFQAPSSTNQLDGKLVYSYSSKEIPNYQIYTFDLVDSTIEQITDMPKYDNYYPAWHPNGKTINFGSTKYYTTVAPALWNIDIDAKDPSLVSGEWNNALLGQDAEWSPDGNKLAFHKCRACNIGGRNYNIFIYDTITDETRQITGNRNMDRFPSWSPDGKRIVYSSNRDYFSGDSGRTREELYMINIDGSGEQRLTFTGHARDPVWSPDGRNIAFIWNERGETVYLLDRKNGDIIELEPGFDVPNTPIWNKSGERLLIFGRMIGENEKEVRLFSIDNGAVTLTERMVLPEETWGFYFDWLSN